MPGVDAQLTKTLVGRLRVIAQPCWGYGYSRWQERQGIALSWSRHGNQKSGDAVLDSGDRHAPAGQELVDRTWELVWIDFCYTLDVVVVQLDIRSAVVIIHVKLNLTVELFYGLPNGPIIG